MSPVLTLLFSTHLGLPVTLAPDIATAADVIATAEDAGVDGAVVATDRHRGKRSSVSIRLEATPGVRRAPYEIKMLADGDPRWRVVARGRLWGGEPTTVSVVLPKVTGDHALAFLASVDAGGAHASSELLRLMVLDPLGDYDADKIPSGEEVSLWKTDPTTPDLGRRLGMVPTPSESWAARAP